MDYIRKYIFCGEDYSTTMRHDQECGNDDDVDERRKTGQRRIGRTPCKALQISKVRPLKGFIVCNIKVLYCCSERRVAVAGGGNW